METKIITIANQKGGVGKTTTAFCLGNVLESKGYKVLYIDLDKQCNISDTLRGDLTKKGSYEILANKEKAINVIQETINNEYVITSNTELNNIENILNESKNSLGREYRLKESLESVKGYFDFIIIDTPPNINNAVVNALTCTNYLIIVTNSNSYSYDGISDLLNSCKTIKQYTNKDLKIGGILLTRYNGRANINKDLKGELEELAKSLNVKVFNSIIRDCIVINEIQRLSKNIVNYAPKSNALIDYTAFTEEVLKDLEG